ncbi:MAG: hypothetical protein M0036_16030 [Desulfobacteraceae bacterium]|nr:hypothetical protein [Desulfobacteraceae bacterium]
MNIKAIAPIAIFVVTFFGLFSGCATPPVQTWHSIPQVQTITGPTFEAQLEPVKEKDPFFVGFRLTVHNKTQSPLQVDWNATHYFHNGKDQGILIFEGIDPENIQGKIPPESIAAGETFTRVIFPLRTIAFLPRSQRPEQGRRGFMAGVLPAGESKIVLSLKQNDQQLQTSLSLRLKAETSQPPSK